jgi:hypothetical protein
LSPPGPPSPGQAGSPGIPPPAGAALLPGLLPFLPPLVFVPPAVGIPMHPAPPPAFRPVQPAPPPMNVIPPKAGVAPAAGNKGAQPEAFRVGYPEYLRSARIVELAGFAATGVAGMLALTAVGGLVGYRQAKAGHAVRAAGTARFLH